MNRRKFFLGSTAFSVGLASMRYLEPVAYADNPSDSVNKKGSARLRFSSQLGLIPGQGAREKYQKMKSWGFEAVELGGNGGDPAKTLPLLKDIGLEVSALCFGSCGGKIVSEDVTRRQMGIDELKKALENAGVYKAQGVVYVPAFNGQTQLSNQDIRKVLMDVMPELGNFAAEHGTNIIFEPLNRREAFFLRLVADGASICRDCGVPGLGVMGDFYHMGREETSDMGAFISGGKWLKHVHLASFPRRKLPGQDERTYVDGFRGLKYIGYAGFCSFECGTDGKAEETIPKSLAFLKSEWDKAE